MAKTPKPKRSKQASDSPSSPIQSVNQSESTTEMITSTIQLTNIPFNSNTDQFRLWRLKVEAYLESTDLFDELIDQTKQESTDASIPSSTKHPNDKNNKKVKSFLLLSIDDLTLSALTDIEKSRAGDVWSQMKRTIR